MCTHIFTCTYRCRAAIEAHGGKTNANAWEELKGEREEEDDETVF